MRRSICLALFVVAEKDPDAGGVAPVKTPDAELRGFAIAGADRRLVWARARTDDW